MYDPLVDAHPPEQLGSPDSFWAGESELTFSELNNEHHCDVAIIGAGYTGLSCALHLAHNYGIKATLIEANQPGWGCSGRNGGFVLPGTGRLSVQDMVKRWDKATSQAIYAEYLSSINTVESLIDGSLFSHHNASHTPQVIDCERQQGGYLKLAHKPSLVEPLHAQAKALSQEYGDSIIALDAQQIKRDFINLSAAYGGIYYPNAIGVNPWLLCQGMAKQARQMGCKIYGNSSVVSCKTAKVSQANTTNSQHVIQTARAKVVANTLVLASNAYGQSKLHPILQDRTFPVVSSILVTEPLTQSQLSTIDMRDGLMVMDTRALKYYYRLLPDNRLLFGGRGAITGAKANDSKYQNMLKKGFDGTFPMLTEVKVSHFWSGWVNVSFDDNPRIYFDDTQNILYSAGYCGAGLAFSIQAGKRMAQLLMEPSALPNLPYWQDPLKKYPLASLRRSALRGFYAWECIKQKVFRFT